MSETIPTPNLNAMRNGSRIARLTIGALPNAMKRQLRTARAYRRDLEAIVVAEKDEVSLEDAHTIDEAVNAEIHSSICKWLMRERLDKMSVQDIIKCSSEIMRSKSVRNRAVDRLGLGRQAENQIRALYTDNLSDKRAESTPDSDKSDT